MAATTKKLNLQDILMVETYETLYHNIKFVQRANYSYLIR